MDSSGMTVEEMLRADSRTLADPEVLADAYRGQAQMEAVVVCATGAFDASRDWEADGARSAAAWLATELHIPKRVARRNVRLGRALRDLPECEEAWRDGDITGDHVEVIAGARNESTAKAMERDLEMLVGYAKTLRFDVIERLVMYWKLRADPIGADDDEHDRHAGRSVFLDKSFQGMWFGKMTFDPISGEIVDGELSRLEKEMFDADWAEAKERLGREPTVLDLARTPAQRRADAMVEMAIRSRTAPADARRPAPLFTVHVGYETMFGPLCELDQSRIVLAPSALLPWLTSAYVERAVWRSPKRVEVSERDRFFTGATRRGVELRDRECAHEYCDVPGSRCQCDHIVPYTRGGPTVQENGQMLCPYHNGKKSDRSPPPDAA
jgi:hypothetical protein